MSPADIQPPRLPEGTLSLQTVAMPADTNWFGDVFGGWLVSQMDLAGAIAARKRSNGRVATIAIDDMVFHTPVKVGDIVACYTTITKVGNTSMHVHVDVWESHCNDIPPRRVTEGLFVYVAIDDNGQKRQVPPEPV